MPDRRRISSQSPWEDLVGYSRAVRVRNVVYVSGTTATDSEGRILGGDNPYKQAKHVLEKIGRALQEAGGSIHDVVRTRIYVTNIDNWQQVGRAHREVFGDIKPATTMVEVARLISAYVLVEIEAEAVVDP